MFLQKVESFSCTSYRSGVLLNIVGICGDDENSSQKVRLHYTSVNVTNNVLAFEKIAIMNKNRKSGKENWIPVQILGTAPKKVDDEQNNIVSSYFVDFKDFTLKYERQDLSDDCPVCKTKDVFRWIQKEDNEL
ncbi:Oidioi.mRNA.OKI2018_I69.chr1.g94.t1.cds [Oikopleura dioica]|uniref:Oidioi.mRNA.OKI2018_I69.chr1.g94.t1.cds n=1 Tax=Oikopleura dioica TaxID=34765 RepID=A0ABN7SNZ0_OIKDI|nr:Oidioi.mRNA.OKI2018_I69.chr1.g94.t1.cds [Oikopleura dioica]